MLPPNARVADIGAHIGYYALIEAQVAQKVYAIEPEPRHLEFLRKNVDLNSRGDRVMVYELAISDTVGRTWLSVSDSPDMHRLRPPCDAPGAECIEVATSTLDEFLKDKEVDVIRMDVEGAEWLAARGMTGILGGNKPLVLFIEVHPKLVEDYGGDALTMVNTLIDSGFDMKYLVASRWPALFSLTGCFRPRIALQEEVIVYHKPLADLRLDNTLNRIVDGSPFFHIFLERP